MCGIGGVLRVWPAEQRERALRTPHGESIPESWLDVLDDAVRHRGPDGHGRFRDRALRADGCVVDVALVHRRLSIIDHAGGHQPMVLEVARGAGGAGSRVIPGRLLSREEIEAHNRRVLAEGHVRLGVEGGRDAEPALGALSSHDRIAVVFNGCIYNHRELRAELQRAGHVFGSDHSDTEVLVHGWREWGLALFDRLDGMHAVVLWDGSQGEWVLARDAFGEKPLYQTELLVSASRVIAAASAVPGLRSFLATGQRVSPRTGEGDPGFWVRPWIKYGWNQGVMPIEGVQEVIGGCREVSPSMRSDDPRLEKTMIRWIGDVLNPSNESLSADRAEELIRHAVNSRLEADVPLGCFLSGGLDSAVVTAMAARTRPDIRAFTVRMPDRAYDESELAAATARAIGVAHTVLNCDPRPAEDLAALIHQLGLPFGDSSLLPTHWVSRAAGREVRVAIGGDGGDEMFLGYDRHRAIPWIARLCLLPEESRQAIADALPIGGGGRRSKRERLARLANAAAAEGYKELVGIFPAPMDAHVGIVEQPRRDFGAMPHYGLTKVGADVGFNYLASLRFDRLFYLPCDLMRKSDTASMSVPLEVRSPMLQTQLARACINAPISSLMPRGPEGGRKGLLREVAKKYLPAEIVDRPKMGFAIPIGEWFRTDYGGLRTMLLDHLNSTEPFGPPSLGIDLNMNFIRQMLDEHLGTGPSGLVKRDHSQRLYMLLVLSVWAKWLGGVGASEGE